MTDDTAKKPHEANRKPARPRRDRTGDARRDSGRESEGDNLLEATHAVVEDEIREGDATPAPDPDQKDETGGRA
jgi:hypothetical protein